MAAVTAQNVTKQFGTKVVLSGLSVELHTGETAGLVGANGSGKTTLFRMIAGDVPPDTGTITTARGLQIGYLKQEPEVSMARTLREEVGSVFAPLVEMENKLHALSEQIAACTDEARARGLMEVYERTNTRFLASGGHGFEVRLFEICGGLGFSESDLSLPMSALSGGQKCRASLAKLLLTESTFLLLDEPTNHLDIDAVRWLEKFLAGYHGGAVIISHDRYLLDRVCDRIIELDRGRATSFPGNYSNYVATREVRMLTLERQFEKDQEFIQKERDFIARHLAGQRTKEAQGRRTRLERRLAAGELVTEVPTARRRAKLDFETKDADTRQILRCDELSMAYDDNVLFSGLSFQVHGGERFGITGPNGTGKTTLLRIIMAEATPQAGSVTLGPRLNVGYYAQESRGLDPQRSVLDEIRAARPDLSEQNSRSILGRYLFTGDDVFKPLGTLSGGEQSRVRLATLILQQPDMLILDEPTNHLDIPSREALEESLGEFPGAIVVVSHDRYLLDRIVTRLLVMRRTGHAVFEGNYSAYLEQTERPAASPGHEIPEGHKAAKRGDGKADKPKSGPSPFDRLSIDEIEALLIAKETELATLHARFGDPAVYQDPSRLEELQDEMSAVQSELAVIETAWHARVETQS